MNRKPVKKLLSSILICALLITFFPIVSVHATEEILPGVEEIIFTTRTYGNDAHWYANVGYWCADETKKMYGSQGRLCKLNLASGTVTTLLEDLDGSIRDPQVSYDATKILFSYRPGGTEQYHLYEINADGTGLNQLTFGLYDDIEPIYLPDGDIMFCSSRSKRYTPCWVTETCTIFRCDANGENIRMISTNHDQDNTPWVLPDGRIAYTRWEYTDRSQMVFHHLWSMNPDGTDQQVLYGNMHAHYGITNLTGQLMIDAKPIPGTNKLICIFSPGHGIWEHTGVVTIVDPTNGPDDRSNFEYIGLGNYKDPYAITDNCFIAARDLSIVKLDSSGNATTLYTTPTLIPIQEPRPLVARSREPIVTDHVKTTSTTGKMALQNINIGRNMEGVAAGEIKKLLIVEDLPKPVSFDGSQVPVSYNSKFYITRILGTVPVEEDGSAYFEVPADRPLTFVALDENNSSVKRMMSFTSVQKGETLSCVGCHETRDTAPPSGEVPIAWQDGTPDQIESLASNIPEIYDFPRDVQPVLDQYCISCHNPDNRQGNVILTGDYGPEFTLSYYTLAIRKQFFTGGDMEKGNYAPRTLGDCISPLMWKLGDKEADVKLQNAFNNNFNISPTLEQKPGTNPHYGINMSDEDRELIKFWINTGGQYAGTYASQGPQGVFPWMEKNEPRDLLEFDSIDAAETVIRNNCNSCHTGDNAIPLRPDDHEDFYGDNWSGIDDGKLEHPQRSKYATDLIYNFTNPDKSVLLLAPLAVSAGGYGKCTSNGTSVFANTNNADYQTLLAAIEDCKTILNEKKRFDMTDFIPNRQWVREMKKYGLIPVDLNPYEDPVDPYEVEKEYYESMWAKTGVTEQWGAENAASGAEEIARFNQVMALEPYSIPANLAKGKTMTVSSNNAGAQYMTDGDSKTCWTSDAADSEWAYVDLGAVFPVDRVKLVWNLAYGAEYKIQVSDDAAEWTDVYTQTDGDGRVDNIRFDSVDTRYIRFLGIERGTSSGYSLYEFNAYLDAGSNIAINRNAASSSNQSSSYTAGKAVDGDNSTRWSSNSNDPQWIMIDLEANYDVYMVKLNWENAYGKAYTIQVSEDGLNWTDVYSTNDGDGDIDEIILEAARNCRYVRLYGTERGTNYGYSLYEFEIYGREASSAAEPELISQWLFNNSGDDNTGNGYTATLNNCTYSTDTAEGSHSVSFNGTNSYIDIGNVNIGNTFTVSMWVKIDAGVSNLKTLMANSRDGNEPDGFRLCVNTMLSTDKKIRFETGNGSGSDVAQTASDTAEFGEWKHVAATVNRTTGLAEIYWDGVRSAVDKTILTDFGTNTSLYIGSMTNNTYLYKGLMDDVRIYDGVLSDKQVKELAGNTNLALYKTAVASTEQASDLTANNASDGRMNTRWSSDWSDPQWIYIDLGDYYDIGRIKLNWESAYGKSYALQVSDDASNWTDVYTTSGGDGGIDDITFTSTNCRYVRMYGTERGTGYGYSLKEFGVYAD